MSETSVIGKTISCLENVLIDGDAQIEQNRSYALKNEQVNFQLVYKNTTLYPMRCKLKVEGDLSEHVDFRMVENVAVEYIPQEADDYFISEKSGLYPDRLAPIGKLGVVLMPKKQRSVWVSVACKKGLPAGEHGLTFSLFDEKGEVVSELVYDIKVIDAVSKKHSLKLTNWMHYDCICNQHKVRPFSKSFYTIFGKYLDAYTHCGLNMLLTPLFTPPLDTEQGAERITVQLVDVSYKNGKYEFGFEKLGKFLKFVTARGIEYIEFSHLFTQWGGFFCPKIMATTENGYEKFFGWEVSQFDPRYSEFLDALLPKLYEFTKALGMENRCYYHLTDEPTDKTLDNYEHARSMVKKHIGDCKIMDALSHYDFYERGLVDVPVCCTNVFGEFEGKGVNELFSYYCCYPRTENYSNRFITMPSLRNRILGVQLYKTAVSGFLHWGFNFYNSRLSIEPINPNVTVDCGGLFPPGDAFIVYPKDDGVLLSLRAEIFKEAVQDYELLITLEDRVGRAKVEEVLDKYGICGYNAYPRDEREFIRLKNELYALLESAT